MWTSSQCICHVLFSKQYRVFVNSRSVQLVQATHNVLHVLLNYHKFGVKSVSCLFICDMRNLKGSTDHLLEHAALLSL